jgi:hypothetical protein
MNDLPAHILSKLERRWASRLARDAVAWRHEKPPHADHKEIVDRTGRHVPVSIRRSPHPPVKTPVQRIG